MRKLFWLFLISIFVCCNSGIAMGQKPEQDKRSNTEQERISNFNPSDKQIEEWIKWLKDPSVFAREEAADALGRSRNPKAIKPLLEALRDPEPSVRQSPARYLGDFGDTSIIPYLMNALKKEPVLFVQCNLIVSLKKLGLSSEQEKEIMPYMENLLEKDGGRFAPKISDFKNTEVKSALIKKTKDLTIHNKDPLVKFYTAKKLIDELGEDPQKYKTICNEVLNLQGEKFKFDRSEASKMLEKIQKLKK